MAFPSGPGRCYVFLGGTAGVSELAFEAQAAATWPVVPITYSYCGWLGNPAPVDGLSHYFVRVSTIILVVQDFATIHSITYGCHDLCYC